MADIPIVLLLQLAPIWAGFAADAGDDHPRISTRVPTAVIAEQRTVTRFSDHISAKRARQLAPVWRTYFDDAPRQQSNRYIAFTAETGPLIVPYSNAHTYRPQLASRWDAYTWLPEYQHTKLQTQKIVAPVAVSPQHVATWRRLSIAAQHYEQFVDPPRYQVGNRRLATQIAPVAPIPATAAIVARRAMQIAPTWHQYAEPHGKRHQIAIYDVTSPVDVSEDPYSHAVLGKQPSPTARWHEHVADDAWWHWQERDKRLPHIAGGIILPATVQSAWPKRKLLAPQYEQFESSKMDVAIQQQTKTLYYDGTAVFKNRAAALRRTELAAQWEKYEPPERIRLRKTAVIAAIAGPSAIVAAPKPSYDLKWQLAPRWSAFEEPQDPRPQRNLVAIITSTPFVRPIGPYSSAAIRAKQLAPYWVEEGTQRQIQGRRPYALRPETTVAKPPAYLYRRQLAPLWHYHAEPLQLQYTLGGVIPALAGVFVPSTAPFPSTKYVAQLAPVWEHYKPVEPPRYPVRTWISQLAGPFVPPPPVSPAALARRPETAVLWSAFVGVGPQPRPEVGPVVQPSSAWIGKLVGPYVPYTGVTLDCSVGEPATMGGTGTPQYLAPVSHTFFDNTFGYLYWEDFDGTLFLTSTIAETVADDSDGIKSFAGTLLFVWQSSQSAIKHILGAATDYGETDGFVLRVRLRYGRLDAPNANDYFEIYLDQTLLYTLHSMAGQGDAQLTTAWQTVEIPLTAAQAASFVFAGQAIRMSHMAHTYVAAGQPANTVTINSSVEVSWMQCEVPGEPQAALDCTEGNPAQVTITEVDI